jgi:hypothetical protein
MERLLEIGGILVMGAGLLMGPSDPKLLVHIGVERPALTAETFYSPWTRERATCVREPDAEAGPYETPAMHVCADRYLRQGYVRGWVPVQVSPMGLWD